MLSTEASGTLAPPLVYLDACYTPTLHYQLGVHSTPQFQCTSASQKPFTPHCLAACARRPIPRRPHTYVQAYIPIPYWYSVLYLAYPNSWNKLEGGTLLPLDLALAGAHLGRTLPDATGFGTLQCSSTSTTSGPSRSASMQRAPWTMLAASETVRVLAARFLDWPVGSSKSSSPQLTAELAVEPLRFFAASECSLPPLPLMFLLGFGCLLRKSSMVASTRSPYFLSFVLEENM